jgi:hypothetical protein
MDGEIERMNQAVAAFLKAKERRRRKTAAP